VGNGQFSPKLMKILCRLTCMVMVFPASRLVSPTEELLPSPPILKVLEDPNAARSDNTQNINLLLEDEDGQQVVDPLLQFEEPDDADNPFFGASPVAASTANKQRRLDHSAFLSDGSREHPISNLHSEPLPAAPYDPLALAASASVMTAVVEDWTLPFQLVGQSHIMPQALSSAQMSAALRTAIRQSALTSHASTTTEKLAPFDFSFEFMTNSSQNSRDVVSRIAFWGSYHCSLADNLAIYPINMQQEPYDSVYLCAPGCLNPQLVSLFQSAFAKPPTNHTFTQLQHWFTEQCKMALADDAMDGPKCHIEPAFFTVAVVQAIQNFTFKGATFFTSSVFILTAWHFIRSLSYHSTSTTIPSEGILAAPLGDLILNIVFLFHIMFHDYNDYGNLGTGHSSFSRYSPLAGHLLALAATIQKRAFQTYWDKSLSSAARFTYTKAVLIAVSELFAIYDKWQAPKYAPQLTFNAARTGSFTTLVLLAPNVDSSGKRLRTALQQWSRSVEVFSLSTLQCDIPRDGFFSKPTPPCFEPSAKTQSNNQERASSNQNNRQASGRQAQPSNLTQYSPSGNPGESQRNNGSGAWARGPILASVVADYPQSLDKLITELNQGKNADQRIIVPTFPNPHGRQPLMLCF
jgi:hypothetical protein